MDEVVDMIAYYTVRNVFLCVCVHACGVHAFLECAYAKSYLEFESFTRCSRRLRQNLEEKKM